MVSFICIRVTKLIQRLSGLLLSTLPAIFTASNDLTLAIPLVVSACRREGNL